MRPADKLDLGALQRRFSLRTSEGFIETFGSQLLGLVEAQAPCVVLQFLTKPDKHSAPLREREVDLGTGVVDARTAPEVRAMPFLDDQWVGVVRPDHILARGEITAERFAACSHVMVVRRGLHSRDIDEAVRTAGLERRIATVINGFSAALALARDTQLVATVPERHTDGLRRGMYCFALPVKIPAFTLSMLWHPRMDGDLAHRWLRTCLRSGCGTRRGGPESQQLPAM